MLWATQAPLRSEVSVPSAVAYFLESLAFMVLSRSEHFYCLQPSTLLNLYLLLSLLFDFIRIRTLLNMGYYSLIVSLLAADMAIKLCLLFLEGKSKRAFFSNADSERPRQETSGIFNRSVFWWLNSLFLAGTPVSTKRARTVLTCFRIQESVGSRRPLLPGRRNSLGDAHYQFRKKVGIDTKCTEAQAGQGHLLVIAAPIYASCFTQFTGNGTYFCSTISCKRHVRLHCINL